MPIKTEIRQHGRSKARAYEDARTADRYNDIKLHAGQEGSFMDDIEKTNQRGFALKDIKFENENNGKMRGAYDKLMNGGR